MGAGQSKQSEKELCLQLHTAIIDGNENLAKELLLRGAVDPNSRTFIQNRKLEHPMITAVENNLPELVQLLIDSNVSVNIFDTTKKTPLHIAVVQNLADICTKLIEHDADISAANIHGDSSLHLAATYNLVNMALLLIRNGAEVNARGYEDRTPLHSASCIPGNADVMRILLENQSDPNLRDNEERTCLHHVAQLGNVQGVELLLSYNVDINEVDSYGKSSLHLAVENEELPTARVLLRNGCEINLQDKEGKTALHIAVKKQYEEIVLFLMERGADANIASFKGVVPLRSAVWSKNFNIAQYLILNGASVNASDHTGVTPLHVACLYVAPDHNPTDKQLVELLLMNGADVNARSAKNGGTPLHFGVEVGNVEICSLLLRYGADSTIKDMKGKTALSYSTKQEISNLLATSIPEHTTAALMPNGLRVALPDRPLNTYSHQNNHRQSSEDISSQSRSSMSDVTGSLPNHHRSLDDHTPSPPPIPERDFTITPPLINSINHNHHPGLLPIQALPMMPIQSPMFSPWQPQMLPVINGMIAQSPRMQEKLRDFKWSSQSDDSTEISTLSSIGNKSRTKFSRADAKSLLSFTTYFPTKRSSNRASMNVCHSVTKATVTKGPLNSGLGCLLDISVAAVSNNVLLYAQSANEFCNSIPRRSNWTQCSNIIHFYTLPSATLRYPAKGKTKRGNSHKENVSFRKAVNVKFPLRSGATHLLNSGEMEAVIMASYNNGSEWEELDTRIEEVVVESSSRKKSNSDSKSSSSLKFAVTSTKDLVMFVVMCRPIITIAAIRPEGGKIVSSVYSHVYVTLPTGLGRDRDIEMEAEKVSTTTIEQLQGKEFSYLVGSSRILHLSGFCSYNDTISQPITVHLPCHTYNSAGGNITHRILMQEEQPPNGDYRNPCSILGPWRDVTDECTDVQMSNRGKRLIGGVSGDMTNVVFSTNVTTSRVLFMIVAVRSFTSSLSRHIAKIPTNILQINRSYQVCFLVHQKSNRESHAVFTIAHKREAEEIRQRYQHNNYKGQKRLSVPQTVFEQQSVKVRISGGIKFSGKTSTSKNLVLHSGLLPMNEKFDIESNTCSYSTENEHIGFLEFSDAELGLAASRLSIVEGSSVRSPLPSDSSVLVLENKNFSGINSAKSSKASSPLAADAAPEKSMLLASLPLVLPRQECKVLLPPSDPLHIISESLLHQVCKSMDEAELKELGFQLGISQERINIALMPLNAANSGTLSRQSSCNVEETGVKLLQEWQNGPHKEDAVTQLCDALRSIGRDNLAHDIKKLCTPFTVEDSGLNFEDIH